MHKARNQTEERPMSDLSGQKAAAIEILKSLLEAIEASDEVCQIRTGSHHGTQQRPTRHGTVEIEPSRWVEVDISMMFKKGRA